MDLSAQHSKTYSFMKFRTKVEQIVPMSIVHDSLSHVSYGKTSPTKFDINVAIFAQKT